MLKQRLERIRWILSAQFGLDPILLARALSRWPRFVRDWLAFRKTNDLPVEWMPCLQDWGDASGNARGEYFWQDLHVAQLVHEHKPERHIDVGSRVDGFVAHVAAFRELEVVDIRPLRSDIPRVRFVQHDMMADTIPASLQADSVSCLHALEHFGLGRYGDPITSRGYEFGIANLARLTSPGGRLYLSVPVGRERVLFNANRIFDPRRIVRLAELHGLALSEFSVVRDGTAPETEIDIASGLDRAADSEYVLGIFVFTKH